MGTVEAIISDNVISEFKQNVVKRKGDTLGDFSSALEQAMQLWIKSEPGKDQAADLKNAIVPEDVVLEFKLQVRKRVGDKLDDFSKAIAEAMQFWSKNDEIEEIKKSLLKMLTSAHFSNETEPLIDALKLKGKAAIPALNELLKADFVHSDEEEYIGNAIKEIFKS
jgi:hypothetical protein